jgi:hypothetical protein
MEATLTRPTSPLSRPGPQELLSTTVHLCEAAGDLCIALELNNAPDLHAMGAEWLRSCYRDLDALLAQLEAMRVQLAEYVKAADEA